MNIFLGGSWWVSRNFLFGFGGMVEGLGNLLSDVVSKAQVAI